MSKLLINITSGPEHPTRAALGFLVAKAAVEEGHDVSIFLAGDAVQLLRDATLDSVVGVGSGSLRDSYDALKRADAPIYASGMSAQARGVELDGRAEAAMPARLVQLILDHDRVVTY